MIDQTAALLALRTRALSLVACTTGSTTLAATSNGYTRTTGSFLTDGFRAGMEVTPSGFTTATANVITNVSALSMTVNGTLSTNVAQAGRSLAVVLPVGRAFANREFTPTQGRPYIEESFVPATLASLTYPIGTGILEETGLYVLKWYGLPKYAEPGILKCVDALKALFAPGTEIVVGANVLRIRADVGPFAGQLLPTGDGWTACTLTIPWRVWTTNVIAP